MALYVIWQAQKLDWYSPGTIDTTTYEGLLAIEAKSNGSLSSYIETNDIEDLMTGIYNETDIDLCYHKVEQSCYQIIQNYLKRVLSL